MSCISRILIFSSWLFVRFEGNFHPIATMSAFYITFLIMVVFNIIFNKSKLADMRTFPYWIGRYFELKSHDNQINITEIVLNSYSSVLHFNHFDYQAMLDEEKKKNKKSHEPTLIRQIIYFLIFFILFLR